MRYYKTPNIDPSPLQLIIAIILAMAGILILLFLSEPLTDDVSDHRPDTHYQRRVRPKINVTDDGRDISQKCA